MSISKQPFYQDRKNVMGEFFFKQVISFFLTCVQFFWGKKCHESFWDWLLLLQLGGLQRLKFKYMISKKVKKKKG